MLSFLQKLSVLSTFSLSVKLPLFLSGAGGWKTGTKPLLSLESSLSLESLPSSVTLTSSTTRTGGDGAARRLDVVLSSPWNLKLTLFVLLTFADTVSSASFSTILNSLSMIHIASVRASCDLKICCRREKARINAHNKFSFSWTLELSELLINTSPIMSSSAPSRLQVLSLYRGILRNANKFPNYNFKSHAKRRTVAAFHEFKNLKDSQQIEEKYRFGQQQQTCSRS
ncbi:LYR motif-containing protein [archaeon]|nr:MAG: LYR motif-containing protein [archaeon]